MNKIPTHSVQEAIDHGANTRACLQPYPCALVAIAVAGILCGVGLAGLGGYLGWWTSIGINMFLSYTLIGVSVVVGGAAAITIVVLNRRKQAPKSLPAPMDLNKGRTITLYGNNYQCVNISSKPMFEITRSLDKTPNTCVLVVVDKELRLYAVGESSTTFFSITRNIDEQHAQELVELYNKKGYKLGQLVKIDDEQFQAYPFPTEVKADSAS